VAADEDEDLVGSGELCDDVPCGMEDVDIAVVVFAGAV